MIGSSKAAMTVGIVGLLAGTFGEGLVANVTGADMPWFAQFGLCGLFGGMLWWSIAKTVPQLSKDNREAVVESAKVNADAMGDLSTKMESVRAEIRAGNDSQLALLRGVLHHRGEEHA